MDWFIAVGIVILLAVIVYYVLRLGIDLLLAGIWFVIAVLETLLSPFRKRRH